MRPAAFDYLRPTAVAEAVRGISGSDGAFFYAGGTELLLALKMRVLRADRLIDLKRIPQLDRIALSERGELTIGARATHRQIEESALVQQVLPALGRLCSQVANIRVRSVGTIGGNLCFAEPHADPGTFLAALGARLHLVGAQGERMVAADEFVLGEFETARRDDELLSHIVIPAQAGPSAYRRFRHGERPSVGVGVSWRLAKGGRTIETARIRFGALGPRPQAVEALEQALGGVETAKASGRIAELLPHALDALEVISDRHGGADYKRHLAATLLQRCIADAHQAALGGRP
ncbi:FAD binding domain-containing protein [Bradyrhizobium sp. NP1]|uniref:FAD binding domain-containing protein n=1 Tax=Bradyrhizobium sp. NP1 TaxID=3049772 RepID=UPI0025A65B59|nr:FAD binding domain-containing protein [Bradyrhizobium sp. NP1]WJR79897.1 FAD binding domain-containing protein [Bradyrhizobium sp. NP1]